MVAASVIAFAVSSGVETDWLFATGAVFVGPPPVFVTPPPYAPMSFREPSASLYSMPG